MAASSRRRLVSSRRSVCVRPVACCTASSIERMLSHTFLHTPAWAARFAPTNLLHDTQGATMIDLPESELDRLLADDPGGPVVMLNLLRFRADGGRERYMEYAARSIPIAERFGAEALYVGDGDRALVAEAGQAWDAVVLM